jgi:alkanesulfonate monooxygenase SsuD/methylene tetrahydromethanopterin reductase-like flavin-dependent oxidoreductase (luciferase family)
VTVSGTHVRLERAVNLPAPIQRRMPILIGGSGERRTLRIVARYADAWNGEGDVATWTHRNRVLDEHCAAVGRDPGAIRRTVGMPPASVRESRDAAVAALVDRLRHNGLTADEALAVAIASPLVGTPGEVAVTARAYAAAGAAEMLIDWPAPFDPETLVHLAAVGA